MVKRKTYQQLVLSTVGASILFKNPDKAFRDKVNLSANAHQLEADFAKEVQAYLDTFLKNVSTMSTASLREMSAEINGIFALYGGDLSQGYRDYHYLVTTDTAIGIACGETVKHVLEMRGCEIVQTFTPKMLTTANSKEFEYGIKDLIRWCGENLPAFQQRDFHIVFNLVGAFKALQGYLNTIGMFYADEMLYLFEGKQASKVTVPRLPIRIDTEGLKLFAVELALMIDGDAFIPKIKLAGLASMMYDTDEESDDAMASAWGTLVWDQMRDEIYTDKLLDFPYLSMSAKFQRDFEDASREERIRLQKILARVAAHLLQHNGDRSGLRKDGGILYETYQNKTENGIPIDHFRVTQKWRVTCQPIAGKLVLRRFSTDHDINENP